MGRCANPPNPRPPVQIFDEMKRIDAIYSVNQPSSGVSPYITTGSSTAFHGSTKGGAGASGGGDKQETRLRAYLNILTNESLALSIEHGSRFSG